MYKNALSSTLTDAVINIFLIAIIALSVLSVASVLLADSPKIYVGTIESKEHYVSGSTETWALYVSANDNIKQVKVNRSKFIRSNDGDAIQIRCYQLALVDVELFCEAL